MAEVFKSTTGASIRVLTRDHCEPHVHAVNEADAYEAKFQFSFIEGTVTLIKIWYNGSKPKKSDLEIIKGEILRRLDDCRYAWWSIHGQTCLGNKWVVITDANEVIYSTKGQGAQKIVDATYDPDAKATTIT